MSGDRGCPPRNFAARRYTHCSTQEDRLTIRKAPGSEDISGDYNVYTEQTASVGALIITLVQEGFQSLQDYRMLIYGIFLLIVILFQPKGVVGLGQTFSGLLSKRGGAANGNS